MDLLFHDHECPYHNAGLGLFFANKCEGIYQLEQIITSCYHSSTSRGESYILDAAQTNMLRILAARNGALTSNLPVSVLNSRIQATSPASILPCPLSLLPPPSSLPVSFPPLSLSSSLAQGMCRVKSGHEWINGDGDVL